MLNQVNADRIKFLIYNVFELHSYIQCCLIFRYGNIFPVSNDLRNILLNGVMKYGAKRSNPDGSISLLSRRMEFIHPVSKEHIVVEAPLTGIWERVES